MKPLIPLLLLAIAMNSCSSQPKSIGGQKDSHGCLTAAGNTWSALLRDCVRPWERGTRLLNAEDTAATTAAYVILSPDRQKAELFLPSIPTHPILNLQDGTWRKGNFTLTEQQGRLRLSHSGRLIYAQP